MKKAVVITGGAGGIGLATAKLIAKDNHIVICDSDQHKLDQATEYLKQYKIASDSMCCDITDRDAVFVMARKVRESCTISAVIHTAGISPQMADPETILRVNALGTININEAFFSVADGEFNMVNVASMAAYLVPSILLPRRSYALASSHPSYFIKKSLFRCRLMPKALYRVGLAYSISKDFVVWYSKANAAKFGGRGARILSVSPGTINTNMGRLEEKSGSMEMLKSAALKRPGAPEEIAELLAFCASDKASYLTGIDILCDGGVVAAKAG